MGHEHWSMTSAIAQPSADARQRSLRYLHAVAASERQQPGLSADTLYTAHVHAKACGATPAMIHAAMQAP